ncbi:NUDIX hydrolase [Mycolicibacterium flavescens]|uniref:NUDIX hydrolase n=1 Tax=Mycolicibacterium flavescens TaxID=1776 RepID=UPI001F17603B|nr:NUDIX hydrolase [Mycolicibacterium flavescens]
MDPQNAAPVRPAATAVLARDGSSGLEVLLLKRAGTMSFGADAWVFPGGRVDDDDAGADDLFSIEAARRAAVRETREEAGIAVDGAALRVLSRWVPGPEAPKRFQTWLLFGRAETTDVCVDGTEIVDHCWITPAAALSEHGQRRMGLLPPTWVTLHQLSGHRSVDDAAAAIDAAEPEYYESHFVNTDTHPVILWHGDAGYETRDFDAVGPRHRLHMGRGPWRYERGN